MHSESGGEGGSYLENVCVNAPNSLNHIYKKFPALTKRQTRTAVTKKKSYMTHTIANSVPGHVKAL